MTDIPDDIKNAALLAWSSEGQLEAIARAILTERQRCADVLLKEKEFYQPSSMDTISEYVSNGETRRALGRSIIAINKGDS